MDYDTDKGKVEYAYDTLGRVSSRKVTNGETAYETAYTFVKGADAYGGNATTPLIASIRQGEGDSAMNFAYEYDSRGNITSENRNGKVTTYTYDALGQLIRVNDPNDPTAGESGTTWLYTYDRGGNILSKSYYRYTTGTPGVAHDTILYSYTDSNWKDKLTAYDGQTITYDAIGNPLNDGRRRYEWQAGRQLKKVYVKADLKEGTKPGVDEQSGTVLKIAWSNGNLLDGEVTSTQASAEVTRNGEDVTSEYAASAFAWKRDSGNAGADATWNAAHAGKKALTLTEADLNGDVKITCTLTGNGPGYGSIAVDEDMDATHTRGTLDANDTFQIVNGELKVTTSRGNVYALEDGNVKGAGAKLNGSITAESKLFASQPEDVVEFSYDHNKLRAQKKVTKADGTVETTDYTLHGKLVAHLTRGNDEMHFFYDAQSRPAMVEFNGALYSYVHNLQGDIVGIVDSAGSLVVEYKYDAWGEPVLVRTLTTEYEALAKLNPFRYRGYVFDEETGLYYLRTRYYCPNICRFVNGDIIVGIEGRLGSHNGYAYSYNLPVILGDPMGMFAGIAALGVIIGVTTAIITAVTVSTAVTAAIRKTFSDEGVPKTINPFEATGEFDNRDYSLNFVVNRTYTVSEDLAREQNIKYQGYEEWINILNNMIYDIGATIITLPLSNPLACLAASCVVDLLITGYSDVEFGEVAPGDYTVRVAVYSLQTVEGTKYFIGRQIDGPTGSPLAESWNYFPFEASEVTIKTAWDMAILTTLL